MKNIFYTTLILLSFSNLQAQVQTNEELKSLITHSFGYFPQIKEIENTVETARQKLEIVKTNNPEVSGNAAYTYLKPKIVIPFPTGSGGQLQDFQFAPVNNINTSVDASYTLLDFGRLKADVEKAKNDLKYSTDNVENVKQQLAFQVATIYYNIVYLQKAIGIQDSVLVYLEENRKIISSKLQNGDAIKLDLLNIQSSIDAEQNRKADLKNDLQKQLDLLAYTTGIDQATGKNFDFDLALQDSTTALAAAIANNTDFTLAQDKINQAKADVAIAKLLDRPYVSLHGSAGFKNGYVPAVGEDRFNYNAGVSLKIPIYSGGKTKKQVILDQNLVKQNELAVESLQNNYRKDIAQSLSDIATDNERIQNTRGQIEEALAAEQIAESRYKNGVGTNLEITNASTNVERAELTRLQYEYQLCLAKVTLAKLLGYTYW